MKTIRWRGGTHAIVDGIAMIRREGERSTEIHADLTFASITIGTLDRQSQDAAAYALADLVTTLRGME